MSNIKLRSFESKILYFNGMYGLPVAPYPTVEYATNWQKNQVEYAPNTPIRDLVAFRLHALKKILQDELNEMDEIIQNLADDKYINPVDFLVDIADLMGDFQVYCASENARFGIPNSEILDIIMSSNFSKLGADGLPIIKDGKVQKGPGYWKPEPSIKALLEERIKEHHKE